MIALNRRGCKTVKVFTLSNEAREKSFWTGLKDFYSQSPASEVDVSELKQRLLVTIALQAARTMEESIVTDPDEADVRSIFDFGLPLIPVA